nr:MAG TPA: hypothetical protein [Caudoviricetes sp.]
MFCTYTNFLRVSRFRLTTRRREARFFVYLKGAKHDV